MATLVPSILPALDAVRSIGDALGLRPFTVYQLTRVWTGERPGKGTKTDTTFQLVNTDADGVTHPVRVKQVSRRDIIASGGTYADQMLTIGPITPTYTTEQGGGFSSGQLDPAPTSAATEIFWKVLGPGIPAAGAWFAKVDEVAKAMEFTITVKRLGMAP